MEYMVEDTAGIRRRWVAERMQWDGSYTTPSQSNAKIWKTQRGAQRWIDDRPGTETHMHVIEIA